MSGTSTAIRRSIAFTSAGLRRSTGGPGSRWRSTSTVALLPQRFGFAVVGRPRTDRLGDDASGLGRRRSAVRGPRVRRTGTRRPIRTRAVMRARSGSRPFGEEQALAAGGRQRERSPGGETRRWCRPSRHRPTPGGDGRRVGWDPRDSPPSSVGSASRSSCPIVGRLSAGRPCSQAQHSGIEVRQPPCSEPVNGEHVPGAVDRNAAAGEQIGHRPIPPHPTRSDRPIDRLHDRDRIVGRESDGGIGAWPDRSRRRAGVSGPARRRRRTAWSRNHDSIAAASSVVEVGHEPPSLS